MKRRNLKNTILITTASIAVIVFILSACALDSDSWLPFILGCASLSYLVLFAYANKMFYGMEK